MPRFVVPVVLNHRQPPADPLQGQGDKVAGQEEEDDPIRRDEQPLLGLERRRQSRQQNVDLQEIDRRGEEDELRLCSVKHKEKARVHTRACMM